MSGIKTNPDDLQGVRVSDGRVIAAMHSDDVFYMQPSQYFTCPGRMKNDGECEKKSLWGTVEGKLAFECTGSSVKKIWKAGGETGGYCKPTDGSVACFLPAPLECRTRSTQ